VKVGIIGAGTMGAGIAQVFACAEGYSVVLCDVSAEQSERGKAKVGAALEKLVSRGKMADEDARKAAAAISVGTTQTVADCDLIVEAALEDMKLKRELFAALDGACKAGAIFVTNTSSLSVTEIGAGLGRPVIGMHFFNPVPVMKLVEIVAPDSVPPEVVGKVKEIAASIGKTSVMVKDSPGFIVNRLLIPFINEAIGLLAEGAAEAADIDTAMKLGANHPMGPLELADLIGLDICLAIMEDLHARIGDQKYCPHPRLREMVKAGTLGRKSGKGFYSC